MVFKIGYHGSLNWKDSLFVKSIHTEPRQINPFLAGGILIISLQLL